MREEDIQKYLQMLGQALQERRVRGKLLIADGIDCSMRNGAGEPGY